MFVPLKVTQEEMWIDPELLNHVAILPRGKEFMYHVVSAVTVNSVLQA